MNGRQKLEIFLMLFLSLIAFATYHEGTGSVQWIQWVTFITLIFYTFVFDVSFTDESMFIFDPDADNWRRKTEAAKY
eukprot:CAMPEP_0172480108 /NCGR_PEP_ID=MMETSP1066-20121228/5052_1 /TAXON_ID=671091 /ORGANISM="Coscinodiscus wailesii, Strain CCMP2513" /LENGTH=76 /DNA_ID=CAMNT_0013241131 /DNA_START=152 /DNA_END=382 /DNA_ORIENTATION=-